MANMSFIVVLLNVFTLVCNFCIFTACANTAQPEVSTNSSSNSKYYKCPEEEKIIMIHNIKDIRVSKDTVLQPLEL